MTLSIQADKSIEAQAHTGDRTWEVPPQGDDSLLGKHAILLQLCVSLSCI